jgi:hypothetical protein
MHEFTALLNRLEIDCLEASSTDTDLKGKNASHVPLSTPSQGILLRTAAGRLHVGAVKESKQFLYRRHLTG